MSNPSTASSEIKPNVAPGAATNINNNNGNAAPPPPPPQGGLFGGLPIWKMIMLFYGMQLIMSFFNKPDPKTQQNLMVNIFEDGQPLEFHITVNKGTDVIYEWIEKDINYNFDDKNLLSRNITFNYDDLISKPYPEVFVGIKSRKEGKFDSFVFAKAPLVYERQYIEVAQLTNLLFDQSNLLTKQENKTKLENSDETQKSQDQKQILPYLRSQFFIYFVHDNNFYPINAVPPPVSKTYEFFQQKQMYKPPIDVTQFWVRKQDLINVQKLNKEENSTLTTHFQFNMYWSYKYIMIGSLNQSKEIYSTMGMAEMMDEGSIDMMKEMLADTNPYYLGVTFTVSTLHSIFEVLSVKSDLEFWRNIENYQGISLRTIWSTTLSDVIILLYLIDNMEETSWIIVISSIVGLIMNIWKIKKMSQFTRRADGKFPWFHVDHQQSFVRTTDQYDKTAVKWLLIAITPVFIGYCIYSLIYNEHKGWWSFILNCLVSFIYLFGFINMTPQLYINYKLKSVEHIPWKYMTYKFLNTIVDDFFAFVISQPWLRRLSVFRDDIIFVIYLYQRHIYKIDKRRTQYGFVADQLVHQGDNVNTPAPHFTEQEQKEKIE